jgi:hypothetical protein
MKSPPQVAILCNYRVYLPTSELRYPQTGCPKHDLALFAAGNPVREIGSTMLAAAPPDAARPKASPYRPRQVAILDFW